MGMIITEISGRIGRGHIGVPGLLCYIVSVIIHLCHAGTGFLHEKDKANQAETENIMKKTTAWLAILAVMAAVLSGCQSTTGQNQTTGADPAKTSAVTESETTKENVSAPAGTEGAAKETVYPVTVKDSNGTEVTITEEPEKIISLGPNITEMIFALGAGDKLAGRTTYCDYPKEAEAVDTVGTLRKPDIEKIISLEPDIVVASTHFSQESEEQLTDLGIQVLVLYEEHDVTGVYTMVETLGMVVNANKEAASLTAGMKDTIEKTKEAVAGREAPSVYYVVGYGENGDYSAGGDTFVHQLITLAGGDNIAKDVSGWSYSLESLLEADPDIVIVGLGEKEGFSEAENYKELSAVKKGQVFEIDRNLLDRQGVRNAEGVKALADIFYSGE